MPFISTHTHIETPWTASTMKEFIKRAQALGRTHIAYTDIGQLTGAYKLYKDAIGDKKQPLKPILGMEMFIEKSGGYVTITVHCRNQDAYQALVKVASRPRGEHKSKKTDDAYPTYYWQDLMELAKFDVTFTLSGPHSIYVRPYLAGIGGDEYAMDELINAAPGRVYVALIAASEDSVQHKYVRINGKALVRSDLTMKTDYGDRIPVTELLRPYHSHKEIFGFYAGYQWRPLETAIAFEKAKEESRFSKLGIGDAIKAANLTHFRLAIKRNLKILLSDYAFMANADDKVVQPIRSEGRELQPTYYMMSDEEATQVLSDQGIPVSFIQKAIESSKEWASSFDGFKFKYDWRLPKITEKPTKVYMMELIKKVGRMKWDDPVYVERLKYEIGLFVDNGIYDFGPYFFPIAKVFDHYRENGRLTGPGRGSVTGSLMSYCMGFTHLDPIEYGLPFERFFSMDRIKAKKIPDVDVDLPDRTLLVGEDGNSGWLYKTFGDKAAQISTRGMLRLKSSIQDVNRAKNDGTVEKEIELFTESLPSPPQGVSDADWIFGFKDSDGNVVIGFLETSEALQDYIKKRPDEWEQVLKMLAIPRQNGRHASAFVIADCPISDVIPTMKIGDTDHISQYEAKQVEDAGLIKFDFLCLLQLIDIEGCLKRINAKHKRTDYEVGWFDHNGEKTFIWKLPKTDEKTAQLMANGHLAGLFQISTNSMEPFVLGIQPQHIVDTAIVLALVRPGPLDFKDEKLGINMAQKYVKLRHGEIQPDNALLASLLPNSYGVIVFQEDLTHIARTLAGMSGERAEILRDNMCKKRMTELIAMKPEFMEGALKNASAEDCELIWNMMQTFGQYGFSCFGEEQLIETDKGFESIKNICDNIKDYKIAFLDNNGQKKYENPIQGRLMGEREVFEISLEDGSTIQCTEDHLFFDGKTWIRADDLISKGCFYTYEQQE
jgi:DNA polymerase III alpha subunit